MKYDKGIINELNCCGVAIKEAMPRFLNDTGYYLETLQFFLEDNEIEEINKNIKNGNLEEALNHGYNLVSLTGTLGMEKIYNSSKNLCKDIKAQKKREAIQEISVINENLQQIKHIIYKTRLR